MLWKLIKKIGILVAVIAGLIVIYNFFFSPKGKLVAQVEFSNIQLPITFDQSIDELQNLLDADHIENILKSLNKTSVDSFSARDMSYAISRYLWSNEKIASLRHFFRFDGIWFVKVTNQGNSLCSSVSITLPKAVLVSVSKEGRKSELSETLGTINVGDLKPSESVSIVAWTDCAFSLSAYLGRSIKLSHNNGIGRVIVMVPVEPFWGFVANNWVLLLILVLLIPLQLYQIYSDIKKSIKYSRREKK